MRPFRFALQTAMAASGKEWRERARRIEDLGFSTLFIPDHFGEQFGPIAAMTAAAEATDRLNVGSLVLDNDFRHPLVLAKELATLDLFSEGRLEAGIGAGWMRTDYDESGLAYDPPGVRIERLAEALTIMKALWRDGTATFEGRHYRVTGARGEPRPFTKPHPKLVIGGGGRRMLELAAREADIVGVNMSLAAGQVDATIQRQLPADRFAERVAWVREVAGDRMADIDLQMLTFFVQVVPNRREVAEQLAPTFGLTADEALDVPLALLGTVDEICEVLVERRERFGFNYWVVHDAELDDFAPVVARLAGT